MTAPKLLEMSTKKDSDELDVSDSDAAKLIEHVQNQHSRDKLLTSREELLTPKGKAEAIVVECLDSARECVLRLLQSEAPNGSGPGEQNAAAAYARTQFEAAKYILDKSMGIAPRQNGRPVRDAVGQIQVNAVTAALAKRLAQKQVSDRKRFVNAVPAQASDEHTSVSDTNAQTVAADGGSPAADSGDQG